MSYSPAYILILYISNGLLIMASYLITFK